MSALKKKGYIYNKDKAKFISSYDPNGSYTGNSVDLNEKPIQDVDDL